jgi:hypothetical protein
MLSNLERILVGSKLPVSMRLSTEHHSINISYVPNKGWIFIDANNLPAKEGLSKEKIAELVMAAFNLKHEKDPKFNIKSVPYIHEDDTNKSQVKLIKKEFKKLSRNQFDYKPDQKFIYSMAIAKGATVKNDDAELKAASKIAAKAEPIAATAAPIDIPPQKPKRLPHPPQKLDRAPAVSVDMPQIKSHGVVLEQNQIDIEKTYNAIEHILIDKGWRTSEEKTEGRITYREVSSNDGKGKMQLGPHSFNTDDLSEGTLKIVMECFKAAYPGAMPSITINPPANKEDVIKICQEVYSDDKMKINWEVCIKEKKEPEAHKPSAIAPVASSSDTDTKPIKPH